MKRYGNLYPEITSFENLLLAAKKAQKGKRFRPSVLEFNDRLESNLGQLKRELETQTYQPGEYREFWIYEPKPRLISAAPYRDRVVHHALCNIIVPIFERSFIGDSYANRVGFGTHRALKRFVEFFRSSDYIFQCDIKKYFPSIDREILKSKIRKKIKCPQTLWLVETIIDNSNPQEPVCEYFPGDDLLTPITRSKGLPIGNLTSQFFANIYLSDFDRFVKEELKVKKYLRYVDDFSLFGDDREFLKDCRQKVEAKLMGDRLKIHSIKSQIFSTRYGGNFVGFRVFRERIRVRNYNLQKARVRLKQLEADWKQERLSEEAIGRSLQSWIAHLEYGNTWQLRQQIFTKVQMENGLKWLKMSSGAGN